MTGQEGYTIRQAAVRQGHRNAPGCPQCPVRYGALVQVLCPVLADVGVLAWSVEVGPTPRIGGLSVLLSAESIARSVSVAILEYAEISGDGQSFE